jgi:hypothetical protein
MEIEDIILTEISEIWKHKYSIFFLTWERSKSCLEIRIVITKDWEEWLGRIRKIGFDQCMLYAYICIYICI